MNFLENSMYIDAIYVLFGRQFLHLSYLQAGSLIFIGWYASIVFDFAGGVVADLIGRKRTQMYGLALQFAGFVPYVLTKNYGLLAVGSLAYGIGLACSSNTLQALVYEQAREESHATLYQRFNAVSQAWTFAGKASAALLGGLAYALDPRLPYGLMLVGLGGAFVACARIQVPKKAEDEVADDKSHTSIARTALHTFRGNRQLLYFAVIGLFFGVISELLFSYYQPFYLTFHVSPLGFGLLYLMFRGASGLGAYIMQHLPNKMGLPQIQLISVAGVGVSALLMLVLRYPAVLFAPLAVGVCIGFGYPALRLFVNAHARDSARAATLSFATGAMNLGVGVGLSVTFWMADRYAVPTVLHIILAATAVTIVMRVGMLEGFWKKLILRVGRLRVGAVPLQGD
jgi:MFS family permease